MTLDDVAVVLADRRGRVEFWSRGAEALFGYAAADVVGTPITRLVPEHLRARHGAGWRDAWSRGGSVPGSSVLIPVRCADGEVRRFASCISPILDAHGAMIAVMATWSAPSERDDELTPLAES